MHPSAGKAGVSSLFRTPSVAALRPAARLRGARFRGRPVTGLRQQHPVQGTPDSIAAFGQPWSHPPPDPTPSESGAGETPSGEGSDERPSSWLLRLPRQAVSGSRWVDPGPAEQPVSRPGVLDWLLAFRLRGTGVRCLWEGRSWVGPGSKTSFVAFHLGVSGPLSHPLAPEPALPDLVRPLRDSPLLAEETSISEGWIVPKKPGAWRLRVP